MSQPSKVRDRNLSLSSAYDVEDDLFNHLQDLNQKIQQHKDKNFNPPRKFNQNQENDRDYSNYSTPPAIDSSSTSPQYISQQLPSMHQEYHNHNISETPTSYHHNPRPGISRENRPHSLHGRSGLPPRSRTTSTSTLSSLNGFTPATHPHFKPFPTPGSKIDLLKSYISSTGGGGSAAEPFSPKSVHSHLPADEDESYQTIEELRLLESDSRQRHWKRWGPYLSERQWATVREDYSYNGDAWSHFPFEHARSRAYRWGEDGLGGLSDTHQRICFSLAVWNEKDDILKERLFGVANHQGNHGEDVKELYYYLDSTPTHSYMKFLYKYPQAKFPYEKLILESQNRSREVEEFELFDTGVFDDDKYWDIFVEYAKDAKDPDAISIRITAFNRGPEPANLHLIPQVFFRNDWSWDDLPEDQKPTMRQTSSIDETNPTSTVEMIHPSLPGEKFYFHFNESPGVSEPPNAKGWGEDDEDVTVEDTVVPEILFTENETNFKRLYGGENKNGFAKDGFGDYVIGNFREGGVYKMNVERARNGKEGEVDGEVGEVTVEVKEKVKEEANVEVKEKVKEKINVEVTEEEEEDIEEDIENYKEGSEASDENLASGQQTPTLHSTQPYSSSSIPINPEQKGTKAAGHFVFHQVPPNGGCCVVRLKLTKTSSPTKDATISDEELFDQIIEERKSESDEFYSRFNSGPMSEDLRNVMRQALAGMMWSKQLYLFHHKEWSEGDKGQPKPPDSRKYVRNKDWKHLYCEDILSMPDKWEYPFFAAWDTAFHCIPLAMIDPSFAKQQLDVMTREWYMKPDGALPAYEWNFSDVNPPVHAWSTFRIFKLERKMRGKGDLQFLERVFQKLLLNFTWWVNRKDSEGANVFEGGFLGLDNIGLFNRSEPLPTGGTLRQADGTAWMAFYSLQMLNMALELAKHNPVYEDIASKFFEHFLVISDAMTYKLGDDGQTESLWNEEDGFYYDAITWGSNSFQQLPVRSLVGLIPLYATLVLEPNTIKSCPGFKKRMDWLIEHRDELWSRNTCDMRVAGKGNRTLLSIVSEDRLRQILTRMLDETEFLSDFGIRSLSKHHKDSPYSMTVNGQEFSVNYWPGDSRSGMFGGNSNWRGPIWLATTFLIIESLQRFYQYYGDRFMIECPTGSGDMMNLANVADEIQHRLIHIFARDIKGSRAYNGGNEKFDRDPNFRDHLNFFEFFHADSGKGLGASHQTGWTGLVAFLIWHSGSTARLPGTPRTPRSMAAHYFDEQVPTTPSSEVFDQINDLLDARSCSDMTTDEL